MVGYFLKCLFQMFNSRNLVLIWPSMFSCIFSAHMTVIIWFLMLLLLSPTVCALSESGAFPNVTFNVFSDFISKNFHKDISLSIVLLIFFSLIENSDLLNLHARQKIKVLSNERNTKATGWMKCLL